MSIDREVLSEKMKKSYFCKVCEVACLNRDCLYSHYKDEEHIEMEEACYGRRYGKYFYSCLQDYILCPLRKEPLIGLQYIIQLYPEVDSEDAFKCSLCKVIGPLYFIMKHIESYKHRRNYLSIAYKQLLPLFTKRQSYYQRNLTVREHAIKVEQQEKTISVNDSKSCASRIGVKSDFWKYNLRRQEKLEKSKEKHSAYETQKKNILQYMETLVITSPEEAALVQNLTEELEAAVNVYNLNVKPKHEKYYKRGHGQNPEDSEGKHLRHSDLSCSKRRSIWYEKKYKSLSSSACKGEVKSTSDEHSFTQEGRTRKRSRSASKDMLLKVTFSTGSENEAKSADLEIEQQRSPTTDSVKNQSAESNDNQSGTSEAMDHNLNVTSDLFQEIKAKRFRKYSTDVAKWESLFANHRPETSPIFSWSPKSSSLDTTEASPSNEKKYPTRRASLDALSTFTLFSEEGHEHASASSQSSSYTFSSLRSPGFKPYKSNVPQNRGPQHENKQVGNTDQELPCTSNKVCNEVWAIDNIHTGPKQQGDEYTVIPHVTKAHPNSEAETSCDQLSDVNVAQVPELGHIRDARSEYFDLKAYGNGNLVTKNDSQDADSSVLDNTLTSGKLHASGRQLSPEVLQLFKGKDTNSIVHILKTLSPFYPALQELDLEVFAKVLSKNGAITE